MRTARLRMLPWFLAVLILSSPLASCGEDDGPTSDPEACTEFVVPNRLGYRWDRLNHRISIWEFEHRPADSTCKSNEVYGNFVGGDFSTGETGQDTPAIKYTGQPVTTDASQIGAARIHLEATIGPDGVFETTETLSRDDLDLRGYPRIVAIIEGFKFDTTIEQSEDYPSEYEADHGYTSRGFGASAKVVTKNENTLDLKWGLRFEIGASPDREDHNEAIAHAQVAGELDVLLIGVSDSDLVHTASTSYIYEGPEPEPLMEKPVDPPTEAQQRLEMSGRAGAGAGFHGFRSFDFVLAPQEDGSCSNSRDCAGGEECLDSGQCEDKYGDQGYYVREITVDMMRDSYDDSTGDAVFMVNGFASNSTEFIGFYALHATFESELAWIQGVDAQQPITIDESFETGETTYSLE